ncbi:hypothetical protein GGQ80_000613 [Sphingomonas jinjuensis]|uniref:Lipoprotein n=1 Tax=Sphingomonas jinjuensis TaxID=535907 RepID=A0A840FB42_9SPHN|nr:hypothetical protein [Sphingomonas jinjuensis]MBB4152737.1 hypothetical protein [Sphingomonas jinjuensis]
MSGRTAATLMLAIATTACAATPWNFPVPTMIGDQQGVSMTGFMKTDSEAEVRRRLAERMKCPGQLDFASLVTQRADNAVGTKILQYRAVMRCVGASPPGTGAPQPSQ